MVVVSFMLGPALAGKDGANEVFVTVPTGEPLGWKTFEILTAGDALGAIAKEGFAWNSSHARFDGLGAYRPADGEEFERVIQARHDRHDRCLRQRHDNRTRPQ